MSPHCMIYIFHVIFIVYCVIIVYGGAEQGTPLSPPLSLLPISHRFASPVNTTYNFVLCRCGCQAVAAPATHHRIKQTGNGERATQARLWRAFRRQPTEACGMRDGCQRYSGVATSLVTHWFSVCVCLWVNARYDHRCGVSG